MKYLPLFIDLKNRPVLVIGGGNIAVRKIQMLQRVGAIIKIVAPTLCLELKKILIMQESISWIGKIFQPTMLDTVILVIVATNDSNLNTIIYQNAEKRNVLVNTVDDRDKCSCIFPAIIDRAPILIGISSCGKAPVLVRILREKLESLLPVSLGLIAKLAGIWRNRVKQRITDIICRRRFWEKIFSNNHLIMTIEQGKFKEADQILQNALVNIDGYDKKQGNVTLVGAGPGDRGLLTIRGLQVIQQADVILYDYLVSSDVLDLARRDANKICVGKHAGKHLMSQQELNHFIVKLAQQGNKVVRLKGGDSFIFGRGGEELQTISEFGIPFQIVPGITAGVGVAAYAGIPLTHREYAHSVTFITGHNAHIKDQLNWQALSDKQQTLVVYMGKLNAINISKNLIYHGRHIHTPVAVISRGTYLDQKILIGTLIELEKLTRIIESPTLLIIGDVVLLHNKISWFAQKSLDYCQIDGIINLM